MAASITRTSAELSMTASGVMEGDGDAVSSMTERVVSYMRVSG